MKRKILLASNNQGKVAEIREILAKLPIELILQKDLQIPSPAETGETYIENAIIKARHACKHSGMAAIADDSGLSVDALDGAPGVLSARYAGAHATDQDRIKKLLFALKHIPDEMRTAQFHAVTVFMRHPKDPAPIVCHGIWSGRILHEQRGHNGFGYDPIFYVPSHNCSAAELEPEVKNQISHRGQALIKLAHAFTLLGYSNSC